MALSWKAANTSTTKRFADDLENAVKEGLKDQELPPTPFRWDLFDLQECKFQIRSLSWITSTSIPVKHAWMEAKRE